MTSDEESPLKLNALLLVIGVFVFPVLDVCHPGIEHEPFLGDGVKILGMVERQVEQ